MLYPKPCYTELYLLLFLYISWFFIADCCIKKNVSSCALPLCDQNSPPAVIFGVLANTDCLDPNLFSILSCGIGNFILIS